jgi:hypothetical protein
MGNGATTATAKAARLALMGFDVDGVLTDGTLYFGPEGDEIKGFSSLDGHGLKMLQRAGIEVAIISGRSSQALALRAGTSTSTNCTWASRTNAGCWAGSPRRGIGSFPGRLHGRRRGGSARAARLRLFRQPWRTDTPKCSPASTTLPARAAAAAPCAKSAT